MQIPWAHFSKQKYWWFLWQWSSCFSFPGAHASATPSKKKRASPRKRESRLDVLCLQLHPFSLQISTWVSIWKYVQRCTVICAKLWCLNFMSLKWVLILSWEIMSLCPLNVKLLSISKKKRCHWLISLVFICGFCFVDAHLLHLLFNRHEPNFSQKPTVQKWHL